MANLLLAQVPYFKPHVLPAPYKDIVINDIFQSQDGYLWLGTQDGLFAYDGIRVRPYERTDSMAMAEVTAIYQDRTGRIWAGYQDGKIAFLEKDVLQLWDIPEGFPKVAITGFAENELGQFWFATYGEGAYCWENNHLYNFNSDDGLEANDIYSIHTAPNNHVWLATDGGISICRFRNEQKTVNNLTTEQGLPDDIVRTLLPDSLGNCWIGMHDKGVSYWDALEKKFHHFTPEWPYGPVNALELFKGQEVWVGTNSSGLIRVPFANQKEDLVAASKTAYLDKTKIYDLLKDTEGNIWVASNHHGLCSSNRQFEFIHCNIPNIQAVLKNGNDKLWIGTQDGLYTISAEEQSREHALIEEVFAKENLNIISLYQDEHKNIWAGTFGNGILCFNTHSGKKRWINEKDGLSNGSILSMDGYDSKVWLTTLGGVTEIDNRQDILSGQALRYKNLRQESGLGTNFIYKVFIDSKGRTWFGTDGKGISVLEKGQFKNYQEVIIPNGQHAFDTIPLKTVYSITEDTQGHIWMSTPKDGIFEFDGTYFQHLALKEGIRDLGISSLIADNNGNIIIVHDSGIDILDPAAHHLVYYDSEVGITDFKPNINAFCTDNHGNILLGGDNEIVIYTPLKEKLRIHPITRLNTVSVSFEPVDFQSINQFKHDQNKLQFQYTGIWLTDPKTVKYKYKLEGFDLDWIVSSDQSAIYSNLPPGAYTFRVTSTENDAFDDEPIIQFDFKISKPFWLQWWFILLSILTIIGLIYLYMRMQRKRLSWEAALQKEKIKSQYEALKSQINPHFLFNSFNTLVTIIEEDQQIAVEYVEKLSDFYRTMMLYRDKDIISLQEEIELVKNYTFLLEKRFGDNFQLNLHVNGEPFYVAPLALQMLVENAVKHNIISKSKPLIIDIRIVNKDFIQVSNNIQQRQQTVSSTYFGLQSLQKRYELLSSTKVKIEKTDDYFRVSIPAIK